eukprot:CAMPEP_0176474696 /NCGR_PEP_ID=MMETSP0127-20121128/43176_1 /TAXON_ID=938130 /ORGANISM="Platyophrya macrostoma, Strain WH" /LENGTH=422 /DNA_ID=CAMNT_0017870173 /DNA_START=40 /DNA_END=1305 /DNA_ORIENTATION=-
MPCHRSTLSSIALLICVTLTSVSHVTGVSTQCQGSNNSFPLYTESPVFLESVANGKLYQAGTGNDTFYVVHLWGTPYEQGFAQGQLLKSQIQAVTPMMMAYIDAQIHSAVPTLPQWLVDLIGAFGAPYLLEMTFNNTKAFAPQAYLDEMQGIADGAGVSVKDIQNYNMFPELTKAACSIVGANGGATPNGQLSQLRALDFDPTCPMKDFAQVTIYHDADGLTYANFGWSGMIGVLTGLSNTTLGIGEKVWIKHPKGVDGTHGEPWMFVLRDALTAPNMDAALSRIQNANRTCAIHVGVGDSTTNTFNGLTIAAGAYDVYNWTSLNWTAHPIIEDVFYWDKHTQPSNDPCLGEYLQEYWGRLTAETLATKVAASYATGNMHCITFDYAANIAYVANARKTTVTSGSLNAYHRQFTSLNLAELW